MENGNIKILVISYTKMELLRFLILIPYSFFLTIIIKDLITNIIWEHGIFVIMGKRYLRALAYICNMTVYSIILNFLLTIVAWSYSLPNADADIVPKFVPLNETVTLVGMIADAEKYTDNEASLSFTIS